MNTILRKMVILTICTLLLIGVSVPSINVCAASNTPMLFPNASDLRQLNLNGVKAFDGIAAGSTASTVMSMIDNNIIVGSEMVFKMQAVDKSGTVLPDSTIIGTGMKIQRLEYIMAVWTVTDTATAVVYADVNGTGDINALDLLAVKKHILNTSVLTGPYLQAGSVTGRNYAINALDLLAVKRHLLNLSTIKQANRVVITSSNSRFYPTLKTLVLTEGTDTTSQLSLTENHAAVTWSVYSGTSVSVSTTGLLTVKSTGSTNVLVYSDGKYDMIDVIVLSSTPKNYMALTFDDGPDFVNVKPDPNDSTKYVPVETTIDANGNIKGNSTQALLEALKSVNAPGTFFMIGGNISERSEYLLKEMIQQNCELANHTYLHQSMTSNNYTAAQVKEAVYNCDYTMLRYTKDSTTGFPGVSSKMFRPPMLHGSGPVIAANVGKPMLYGIEPGRDWDYADGSAESRAKYILDNRRDGQIILMHDYVTKPNQYTILAVKDVVPKLRNDVAYQTNGKNYEFVTVTELFAIKGIIPVNGKIYNNVAD